MVTDAYAPYEPLNVPKAIAPGVWLVDGPEIWFGYFAGLKLPFPTRMTIVRLPDGGLWLHSPTKPTDALSIASARSDRSDGHANPRPAIRPYVQRTTLCICVHPTGYVAVLTKRGIESCFVARGHAILGRLRASISSGRRDRPQPPR
jgi:hypothetical protein